MWDSEGAWFLHQVQVLKEPPKHPGYSQITSPQHFSSPDLSAPLQLHVSMFSLLPRPSALLQIAALFPVSSLPQTLGPSSSGLSDAALSGL